jgi:ATP-binding protein involved in chromosome partitioning
MSYFTDANGEKMAIFGEDGGKKLADEFNIPLLGNVPIDIALRQHSDKGLQYSGICSEIYKNIAEKLIAEL